MPMAPQRLKPPRVVGLPRLVVARAGGVADGAGVGASASAGPKREDRRGSAAERGYGHRWRAARERFLRRHPLCVASLANGLTVAADVVDHIVPHRGDMVLFWDPSNWQALSKGVHDSIKAVLEDRWERGQLDVALLRLDRRLPEWFPDTP